MKFVRTLIRGILIVAIFLFSVPAVAGGNGEQTSVEVEKLIEFIEASNCRFKRNGRWFGALDAADHIQVKYRYVRKKGLVKTAEDFIAYAASKSSLSGEVYMVQCEKGEPQKSAEWLTVALARIRQTRNR